MSDDVVAPDCSMTSGATLIIHRKVSMRRVFRRSGESLRTPVRTANYGIVSDCTCSRTAGHAEICKFDTTVFIGQDVGTLDISVDNTLVMEVDETLEYLADVDGDKGFREFPETFADRMEGTILAEPRGGGEVMRGLCAERTRTHSL